MFQAAGAVGRHRDPKAKRELKANRPKSGARTKLAASGLSRMPLGIVWTGASGIPIDGGARATTNGAQEILRCTAVSTSWRDP